MQPFKPVTVLVFPARSHLFEVSHKGISSAQQQSKYFSQRPFYSIKKYTIHYDVGNVTELGKACQLKYEL